MPDDACRWDDNEHTQNAQARYGTACVIVDGDWPYDCEAKRKYPDHVVRICIKHQVWWHHAR
jgi:hypothetical protein